MRSAGDLIIALALMTGTFAAGCSEPEVRTRGGCRTKPSPGWVNDNTYQVEAWGTPAVTAVNLVQKRNSAEDGALSCAQEHVLEMAVGPTQPASEGVQGIVKGGVITKKEFEGDVCHIHFRVEAPGLKKQLGKN